MNPENDTSQLPPQPSQPTPDGGKSKQRKALWIATGIFFVFLVGTLIMALVNKTDNNPSDDKNTSNSSQQPQEDQADDAVALTTLETATLVPPSELPGFTLNGQNETQHQYVKELGTSKACRFNFGTAAADLQPGDSSRAIVDNIIASQRQQGGQLVGEVAQEGELRLKSSDSKTVYTMPAFSASIKFRQDDQEATTNLLAGAAILQNNRRAVINLSCIDKNDLAAVKTLAETITIK